MTTKELWARVENYPNYAVSNTGKVFNTYLNKAVEGTMAGGKRVVSLKSDEGFFHSISVDRLQALADFSTGSEVLLVRRIKVIETGKVYDNADEAARDLLTDKSNLYKALKGQLKKIRGFTVEYVYGT